MMTSCCSADVQIYEDVVKRSCSYIPGPDISGQGIYDEAEPFYARTQAIFEKTLG